MLLFETRKGALFRDEERETKTLAYLSRLERKRARRTREVERERSFEEATRQARARARVSPEVFFVFSLSLFSFLQFSQCPFFFSTPTFFFLNPVPHLFKLPWWPASSSATCARPRPASSGALLRERNLSLSLSLSCRLLAREKIEKKEKKRASFSTSSPALGSPRRERKSPFSRTSSSLAGGDDGAGR